MGGHLFEPSSAYEEHLYKSSLNSGVIWLGINNLKDENKWVRSSTGKSDLQYSNWWVRLREYLDYSRCVILVTVSIDLPKSAQAGGAQPTPSRANHWILCRCIHVHVSERGGGAKFFLA